jgi:hypothetical protein
MNKINIIFKKIFKQSMEQKEREIEEKKPYFSYKHSEKIFIYLMNSAKMNKINKMS